MNLVPTALTWTQVGGLLAAAGLVVTLLYLVKTRRRRVRVPFGPLWTEVLGRREVSSLWRLLKQVLSWLLAALVAVLLVSAAADPRPPREQEEGRSLVLLVDTSASMAATDVPGGRLALAKAHALQAVERLVPADRAMLLSVDGQVVPLVSFTRDPALLRPAIQALQASATAADWPRALRFAHTALRGRPHGEILLITDAALPPGMELPGLVADGGPMPDGRGASLNLQPPASDLQPVIRLLPAGPAAGEGGDNVAILAFNVRRYPVDRTSYELFLRVKSTFARPVRCELNILADGVLAEHIPLTLQPGEELHRVFPDLPVLGRKLLARLVFPEDVVDFFPTDDEAYALLPEQQKLKVALVGPGNLFLEAALLLDAQVELTRLSPEQYRDLPSPRFDVTLLDRTAPRPDVAGPRILIAPPPEGSPWPVEGSMDRPELTFVRRDHPLLRWVTLNDLNIDEAWRVTPAAGDTVLAAARQGPLLLYRGGASPTLLFTFDVVRSDLPLRAAFPMLLLDAFEEFFHHDAELLATYRTGETWHVSVPEELQEVVWVAPDGTRQRLPAQRGAVAIGGRSTGFHRLLLGPEEQGQERWLAANLADPRESDIRPRPDLLQAAARDAASPAGRGAAESTRPARPRRPPWMTVLAVAFAILLLEWFTYQRRVTV